jgi:hypothetical protein
MKKLLLSGIAALFLATGAVHAKDVDMCVGPHATEIPCAELDNEFMCGKSDIDTVYIRTDHLLADLSTRALNTAPNARSLSRMRYFGAVSHGNASVIWRANHSAVGVRVTANHNNCRRLWPRTRNAKSC